MLYTVTLATAQHQLRRALEVCAQADGPVIFHFQKGKDRTGLVAMLLQSCLGATDGEIVSSYAQSGPLIGENSARSENQHQSSGTFIDWSKFRGSPSSAMVDTLYWLRNRYGSVNGYLKQEIGIEDDLVARIRQDCQQQQI